MTDARTIPDMTGVRRAIDALDRDLVELLARRFALIRRASELKNGTAEARVPWRIEEVARKVRENAEASDFDADLAEAIWRGMMEHCIAFEERRLGAKSRA
jgi:isochorismate pyruvate lyase